MRRRPRLASTVPLFALALLGAADAFAQAAAQPPAPAPVTRFDERVGSADLDAPRAVSLTISQPLAVREALLLLVTGTPFSVVTSDSVDGSFAGDLKELSLRQALEAVLFPRSLDYTVDGTVIRVHPQRPVMRLFDVSYLNVRRESSRAIRSSSRPGGAPSVEVTTVVSGSFFDDIEKGVNALLSGGGKAHVDRHNGLVQVTDLRERVDRIALYLETVHMRAVRQVRLEARVFEVTLKDGAADTLDWGAVAQSSGEAWTQAASRTAGVRVAGFTNVLKAIAEQGEVRMLAAPHVVAMNNEPAVMRLGTQDVFFTTTTSDGPSGSERAATPVPLLEGLTMTITPQIAADGIVHLSVSPSYAEKTGEARSRQGERVPVLNVAEADTLVRLRDGEAVVLSGFLQERTRTKQGEGFAAFFGAQSKETVTAELVIILRATIVGAVTPAEEAR